MTPKKGQGRGIGTYLIIAVLVIVALVFFLPQLKGDSKGPQYSEIIQYFDDYNVKEYTLDLGSGELKMVLKDGEKITYDVPNVSLFLQDTEDYRQEYNTRNQTPLKQDYYKVTDSSWLLTLIPTLLLIVMMVVLFIFMMRQANGGGKYTSFGKANIKNQMNTRKATFADVAEARAGGDR